MFGIFHPKFRENFSIILRKWSQGDLSAATKLRENILKLAN